MALVTEKPKIKELMGLVPSEVLDSVSKRRLPNPLGGRNAVSLCLKLFPKSANPI